MYALFRIVSIVPCYLIGEGGTFIRVGSRNRLPEHVQPNRVVSDDDELFAVSEVDLDFPTPESSVSWLSMEAPPKWK